MTLLSVSNLGHRFGRQWVFKDLSFNVHKGEALAILGPNGAGKTTLLKILSGEIRQTMGQLAFKDRPLTAPLHKRIQLGVGVLPQASIGFWNLSVLDNLKIASQGIDKPVESIHEILKVIGLEDKANVKAGSLSGGEKRRMEIGRCLTSSPSLLLLDEPFSALDPKSIELVVSILQGVVKKGSSVVFGDHAVSASLHLSTRAMILDRGEILASGTPQDVANNELVRQRYLGGSFSI